MQIAIIGSGYVGLVSGACLADFGHKVICVDKDAEKISALEQSECPIFEPGLADLIGGNRRAGRLSFTSELKNAVAASRAVFIAVGTPSRRGDGHADLSYVYKAAREIAPTLNGFTVIITKSTVPVGTGDEVARIIHETCAGADIAVVSNPEFLREGAAIQDFKHPDRIVVGTDDDRARKLMAEIYRPLYLNKAPILYTDRRTAELIKYAANAFLATKITFISEIADLAEEVGADVQEVARGGMEQAKPLLPDITYCGGPYSCADGADGVVIVTEWEQFRALDLEQMKQRMACPVLIDLRNIYSAKDMGRHGFLYAGIGRSAKRTGVRL